MIVNTAYAYMKQSISANPEIYNRGTINYEYATSGAGTGVTIETDYIKFTSKNAYIEFYNVPLKSFTNLKLYNTYRTGLRAEYSITINNSEVGTLNFGNSSKELSIEIPDSLRVNNATIRVTKTIAGNSQLVYLIAY